MVASGTTLSLTIRNAGNAIDLVSFAAIILSNKHGHQSGKTPSGLPGDPSTYPFASQKAAQGDNARAQIF